MITNDKQKQITLLQIERLVKGRTALNNMSNEIKCEPLILKAQFYAINSVIKTLQDSVAIYDKKQLIN